MKLIILILNYICKILIPAFGLICLLCAGNRPTFIFGLLVTILSFYLYCKEKKIK